jgi:hypothetical protein
MTEVGLPMAEIPLVLFSFNFGIELANSLSSAPCSSSPQRSAGAGPPAAMG